MSHPLPTPARRTPRLGGVLALVGAMLASSAVVGAAVTGIVAVARPIAEDIATPLERVTVDGRVSFLYPKGFEAGVEITESGNFRWVTAGGFEDWDMRDLEIDDGDDTPDSLWSVRLRTIPTVVLGVNAGGLFLDDPPTTEEFIAAAHLAIEGEFRDGSVLGVGVYDSVEVDETTLPEGNPVVIATYTWPLSDVEARWAGRGAVAWQTVDSYTLDGDTVWYLSVTGFITDEPNSTLYEVGRSLQLEGR